EVLEVELCLLDEALALGTGDGRQRPVTDRSGPFAEAREHPVDVEFVGHANPSAHGSFAAGPLGPRSLLAGIPSSRRSLLPFRSWQRALRLRAARLRRRYPVVRATSTRSRPARSLRTATDANPASFACPTIGSTWWG